MAEVKPSKDLKSINEWMSANKNVLRQEKCEEHGIVYDLIQTPGGAAGECPECFKNRINDEDNKFAQKALEGKDGWQVPFIKQHENVSTRLKEAKVNTYKPDNDKQEQAKKMAIDYVRKFDGENSLVFSGTPGLGKTHLAYSITKGLRQQGYKVWFIKVQDLLDLIKSTYRAESQLSEERIMQVITTIDCLVLDEVGGEYIKPLDNGNESWGDQMLYRIFDSREYKSIVCTTNYTEQELTNKYGNNGERILSRMMENAKGIRIEGADQRRVNRF